VLHHWPSVSSAAHRYILVVSRTVFASRRQQVDCLARRLRQICRHFQLWFRCCVERAIRILHERSPMVGKLVRQKEKFIALHCCIFAQICHFNRMYQSFGRLIKTTPHTVVWQLPAACDTAKPCPGWEPW
jgi:hypothetical protein